MKIKIWKKLLILMLLGLSVNSAYSQKSDLSVKDDSHAQKRTVTLKNLQLDSETKLAFQKVVDLRKKSVVEIGMDAANFEILSNGAGKYSTNLKEGSLLLDGKSIVFYFSKQLPAPEKAELLVGSMKISLIEKISQAKQASIKIGEQVFNFNSETRRLLARFAAETRVSLDN